MSKDDILNKLLTNAIEITNPDTEHYIPVWWVKQVINDLNLNSLNISNEFESYITQIKDHFNNETNIIFSEPKIIDDVDTKDRKAGYDQRQHCTMNCACYRSSNP